MKRKGIFGILGAAAVTLALAACVYDEGAAPAQATGGQGGFPTAIGATFTPGTQRVEVEMGVPAADWQPGTTVSQSWRRAPMVLEVDFSTDRIEDIRVISHGESMYSAMYFFRAYPMTKDLILVEQSTANVRVDRSQPTHHQAVVTFTGGTATQEMIAVGVERAIEQAGANPLDLVAQTRTTPLPGDRFVPGSHLVHVPSERYVFINGQFFTIDNIPAPWPAWYAGAIPAEGDYRAAATAAGTHRDNGWSLWRYGLNAAMEGVWTGSDRWANGGEGPVVANRVGFHSAQMSRNATSTAGPTWETTNRAGGQTLPANVAALLTARYGTDQNVYYVPGETTMTGAWVLVNFGRNVFQVAEHHAGDGLGNAGGAPVSSGESLSPPRRLDAVSDLNAAGIMGPFAAETAVYGSNPIHFQSVYGSSSSQGLGGYWWMQVAHRTINDNQSTHLVTADAYAGATQSALMVRLGVERAMELAGANPATITPTANPFFVEPQPSTPNALQLVAGRYYINVPGFEFLNNGSSMMAVTICREAIRYIGSDDMNAFRGNATGAPAQAIFGEAGRPEDHWANDWNRFRNEILYSFARQYSEGGRQLSALNVDPMPGNVELSNAVIAALTELLTTQSYNLGNVNQTGRLGQEIEASTGDGLGNRNNWR